MHPQFVKLILRALIMSVACFFTWHGAFASTTSPGNASVTILNYAFSPKTLDIASGTTVTWVNRDEEPHSVQNASGTLRLQSGVLQPKQGYSHTFTKPGTYNYRCGIHPYMQGAVIVK